MAERNQGVIAEPVFVGATRPAMRFGATYLALLGNLVVTMECFLVTKNLLVLLIALPIHGICVLLCARDPRYFELLALWASTRLRAYFSSFALWRGASYSPLALDLPCTRGHRSGSAAVLVVTMAQATTI